MLSPHSLKAVFFDVDGTILDSQKLIISTYKKNFEKMGKHYHLNLPPLNSLKLESLIGAPGKEIFAQISGLSSLFPYYNFFREQNTASMIKAIKEKSFPLMPKTLEIFQFLIAHNYLVGLASNASSLFLQTLVKEYKIPLNTPLMTLDNNILTKRDILKTYLTQLKLLSDEAIMIGDRIYDMEAAKENNMPSIALCSGIGYKIDPKEFKDATLILKDIPELFSWFKLKKNGPSSFS